MDFFDEITSLKKDFPRFSSIKGEVKKYKFNFYQKFAIGMFITCFFLGIILGNLFSTCETTSYFYSESSACLVNQFNFSLMIFIWFVSLIISLIMFSIGHIIVLLSSINEKLGKFKL